MPLPTSGPLSLNDIKGEFGGPTSPSLGDYYAGGIYVPAGTTGTNGPVPSSGPISIRNFYGTSNIPPLTVSIRSTLSRTAFGSGSSGLVVTNNSPNTTVAGGVPPYTYFWTMIAGFGDMAISSATAQNPTWSAVVDETAPLTEEWIVTVTDSASTIAESNIMTITLTYVQI